MKTVGVKINLPSNVYYGVKRFLNINNNQMKELCSALCINRMIDKGYLDEFGKPIELPHLDFSSIDIQSGINIKELRDLFTNQETLEKVPRSSFTLKNDFKEK